MFITVKVSQDCEVWENEKIIDVHEVVSIKKYKVTDEAFRNLTMEKIFADLKSVALLELTKTNDNKYGYGVPYFKVEGIEF